LKPNDFIPGTSPPKKNYRQLDDITDQAGLRIITYYEDEVDLVAKAIKREFEIDSENSIDKREIDAEKFGYYALNCVCRYSDTRTRHVEYRDFGGVVAPRHPTPNRAAGILWDHLHLFRRGRYDPMLPAVA
jgi:hypothetical protein